MPKCDFISAEGKECPREGVMHSRGFWFCAVHEWRGKWTAPGDGQLGLIFHCKECKFEYYTVDVIGQFTGGFKPACPNCYSKDRRVKLERGYASTSTQS